MKIEILEISNGFTVNFFDAHGPSELDCDIYCKDLAIVFLEVQKWVKTIKKSREGGEKQ